MGSKPITRQEIESRIKYYLTLRDDAKSGLLGFYCSIGITIVGIIILTLLINGLWLHNISSQDILFVIKYSAFIFINIHSWIPG